MQTVAALDNFRENLQRRCDAEGISQQELARKSGVHYVTINRILRGHTVPTLPVAEALAKAAGLALEKILGKTR